MYFILMTAISLLSSLKLILHVRGAFRKYSIIFRQYLCRVCKLLRLRVDATIYAYACNFCACRPSHFPAVTPRVETYNARSLDFRFHAGKVASLPTQRILPALN